MNTLFYKPRSKRFSNKTAIMLATVISSFFLLASCDVDPIFAAIEDETAISKGTVSGNIYSLVTVGNDLWVSNGYIYKKTDGKGSWSKQSLPAGHRCAQLATDETDLYALIQNDKWEFDSLYRYNGSNWTPVTDASNIATILSGKESIFAFSGTGTAYTVKATTVEPITNATGLSIPKGSAVTSTAEFFATATQIFDATGAQINGTIETPVTDSPTAGIVSLTSDGTNLFALTSGSVFRYDGISWTSFKHNVGGASSIAWLGGESTGKNLLLIGGENGYGEIVLKSDGTFDSEIAPGDSEKSSVKPEDKNNYSNTIGSSPVNNIFAITSTVPDGDDYVIYTAVSKGTLTGLWAYYNNTSSIWDRE